MIGITEGWAGRSTSGEGCAVSPLAGLLPTNSRSDTETESIKYGTPPIMAAKCLRCDG